MGRPVVELELADLAKGSPIREQVEAALESWAGSHMDGDSGRVDSYDDWVERLEGPWETSSGTWVDLELPGQMDAPSVGAPRRDRPLDRQGSPVTAVTVGWADPSMLRVDGA